jgi:predicted nucleic acid-binding protein
VTARLVADASVTVALLTDSGPDGRWAANMMSDADLHAPSAMPFECANILRRHEQAGIISADQAAQAHADLVDLPVDLWPYEAVAARVWELRTSLSSYSAAYVAVAEATSATLLTLDRRIAQAPGIWCAVDTR